MKKKALSFCLVLLLFSIGAASLVAQDEQVTWPKTKQKVTQTDSGYEVETTQSQCFYVKNFKVETVSKGTRNAKTYTTTVTNTAGYTAKAYINGAVVTFTAGQAKTYPGKVSVEECVF